MKLQLLSHPAQHTLHICRTESQGAAASLVTATTTALSPCHVSKYRQIASAEQCLHEEADVTHWTGTLSACVSQARKREKGLWSSCSEGPEE